MAQANNIKGAHQEYSRGDKGRFIPHRRVCLFCATPSLKIDYKDVALLSRFINDQAKIEPRRRSGACAKHQRALAQAIKQARHLALMPMAPEHIYLMGNVALTQPSPVAQAPQKPETISEAPPQDKEEADIT